MAVLEMKEIFYAYEEGRPILSNDLTILNLKQGKCTLSLDRPVPARQRCCH